MGKELLYNLPGFKEIKIKLFETSGKVYLLLNEYILIDRLKNITQLGSIRFAFPGLHHTRYEYVILQLYFIELLRQNREKLEYIPTTSNINLNEFIQILGDEFKEVRNVSFSHIEFLQILVLLSNIGHFPETFAASKAFLSILKSDRKLLNIYKRGLGKKGSEILEEILRSGNFYKVHLLNSIFILRRLRRKNKELSLLSELIMLSYLYKNKFSNSNKYTLFKTFRNLRNVSFLMLDSLYSLVPFNIDLNLISDNFVEFYHELMEDGSPINSSISRLIQILERSLYFLPKSMKSIYATYKCLLNNRHLDAISSLTKLKKLFLFNDNSQYKIFMKCPEQKIEKHFETKVSIEKSLFYSIDNETYKNINEKIEILNKKYFPNLVILPNANLTKLYITLSLSKEDLNNKKIIVIFQELLKLDGSLNSENNKEKNILLSLILEGTLYHLFNLDADNIRIKTDKMNFIFSTPNKIKKELKKKLKRAKDRSQANEIDMIIECIERIYQNKKRKIIVYFGSLKIKEKIDRGNGWNDKVEIDGTILDVNEKTIILIEAKKEHGGTSFSSSKAALKEKLKRLNINYNEIDIKELSKGAYIRLNVQSILEVP